MAGVRHRLDGRRGEDAYAWARAGRLLVVAVADGVSATPQAALAAQVAVGAACGVAAKTGDTEVGDTEVGDTEVGDTEVGERTLPEVCDAALRAALVAVGAAVGDVANGATTLVVAAVDCGGAWAALRVGDSEAYVLDAGHWWPVFAEPGETDTDDSGVRTGATAALPLVGAAREAATGVLGAHQALVLLSDGVAGPLRDGPSTVAVGLAEGLRAPPAPLELARLVDFGRQGCHDDRTLLALWPTPRPPGAD